MASCGPSARGSARAIHSGVRAAALVVVARRSHPLHGAYDDSTRRGAARGPGAQRHTQKFWLPVAISALTMRSGSALSRSSHHGDLGSRRLLVIVIAFLTPPRVLSARALNDCTARASRRSPRNMSPRAVRARWRPAPLSHGSRKTVLWVASWRTAGRGRSGLRPRRPTSSPTSTPPPKRGGTTRRSTARSSAATPSISSSRAASRRS